MSLQSRNVAMPNFLNYMSIKFDFFTDVKPSPSLMGHVMFCSYDIYNPDRLPDMYAGQFPVLPQAL